MAHLFLSWTKRCEWKGRDFQTRKNSQMLVYGTRVNHFVWSPRVLRKMLNNFWTNGSISFSIKLSGLTRLVGGGRGGGVVFLWGCAFFTSKMHFCLIHWICPSQEWRARTRTIRRRRSNGTGSKIRDQYCKTCFAVYLPIDTWGASNQWDRREYYVQRP